MRLPLKFSSLIGFLPTPLVCVVLSLSRRCAGLSLLHNGLLSCVCARAKRSITYGSVTVVDVAVFYFLLMPVCSCLFTHNVFLLRRHRSLRVVCCLVQTHSSAIAAACDQVTLCVLCTVAVVIVVGASCVCAAAHIFFFLYYYLSLALFILTFCALSVALSLSISFRILFLRICAYAHTNTYIKLHIQTGYELCKNKNHTN